MAALPSKGTTVALSPQPSVTPSLHPLVHGVLLAIFSVGVLLTAGYGFGTNDSANYIPLVWERIEPGLYQGDVMFGEILQSPWNLHTAFFSSIMGLIGRLFTLEWAFFVVHLASLWVFFFALWAIGCAIGGPMVGYLGLAAIAVNRIVGDVVMMLPDELVPRSAAVTMAFLAIALAVRWQRFRLAAAAGSLAILLHPVSACMALPLLMLAPLVQSVPWRVRLREAALVAAILVLPFLIWHVLHASSPSAGLERGLLTMVSADWQRLIDSRMMGQAVNIAPWKTKDWLSIVVPLVFWLLALGRRDMVTSTDRILGLGVAATLVIAALGCVAADVFRLSLFTQMMLVRVLFLPVVIGTLYGVWWLAEQYRTADLLERLLVLMVLASLMLAASHICLLTLFLLVSLQVSRRDVWLRVGVQGLAVAWLLLAVPIATLNLWYPSSSAIARPNLLVFGAPPLAHVLVVCGLLGFLVVVGRRRGPRPLPWLALAAATAPLLLYGISHRHLGLTGMVATIQARVQAPWQSNNTPWRETAYWVRTHTPPGSRFLVTPNEVGFRAMAKRPEAGNWKDGGLVLFSEAHAKRWAKRFQAINNVENLPAHKVEAIARAYGCEYVVVARPHALARPPVFANTGFLVYAMNTPPHLEAK